ncbi:MAG: AzlC family ABC transporter permease [Paracoccaceae bacterium]
MTTATPKSAFWSGFRNGLPFILGATPFGMLFGILATEAGFDLAQVMGMTIVVIAGAAQFTALAQMQDSAPVLMVLAASLAVNMRMAMYSASIGPHLIDAPFWQRAVAAYILVDNTYAVAISEFEERPLRPVPQKMAFYIGCAIPAWIFWYLSTFVGALFGQAIPAGFALDFAPAIVFLALVAPMLKTLAHVAAAFTSVALALALAFLPFSSGLLIAAVCAMLVGAEVERRLAKAAQ